MVATITIYVNTTVIMTMAMTMAMAGTTTMIMTMVLTKTMIMAMVATMTKNFQQDNFYCLIKMIKRLQKFNSSFFFKK